MFIDKAIGDAGKAHDVAIRRWLIAAVALTILVRAAILFVLDEPVVSDARAYFTMAASLVEDGVLVDDFGQNAFYSPGYPLLLSPFFALFGASAEVARGVNLGLAAMSTVLIFAVAARLGGNRFVGLVAAFAFAVWIPSAVGVEILHKENLSIPLLLAFAWLLGRRADDPRPARFGLAAGAVYGASILVGASVLLTAAGAAFALALSWRTGGHRAFTTASLCFMAGAALFLAPWLAHVQRTLGHATITTNGPFNLYLGNNPAATGRFVGIQDTPMGASWNTLRRQAGEYGATQALGREAKRYMAAEPARTARLAGTKLTLFWMPNLPDAADSAASPTIAGLRWIEVVQHLAILVFGVAGMVLTARNRGMRVYAAVLGLIVAGFWVIHAATYIIPRYRDPVMPLMISFAAVAAWSLIGRYGKRRHA